jgi:hypothetical protein
MSAIYAVRDAIDFDGQQIPVVIEAEDGDLLLVVEQMGSVLSKGTTKHFLLQSLKDLPGKILVFNFPHGHFSPFLSNFTGKLLFFISIICLRKILFFV